MPYRLARYPRLLAFVIGGAGAIAELALLAALGGNAPRADAAHAPAAPGTRIEMPAGESSGTILLKPADVSL